MEDRALIQEVSMPIFEAKGWIKILGVISIIYGVLVALSIVGIIIAWLPIWMGILLFKAGSQIEEAKNTGNKHNLMESLSKIKTYFIISGVLTIIGLALAIIAVIVGFIAGLNGSENPFLSVLI